MNPPPDVQIRLATNADLPAILAIYNEAVLTTSATYDLEPRTLEHRTAWFQDHEKASLPVFVAVAAAGEVIGWSALNRYHERFGYRFTVDNSIYITAAHRGRGVGRLLLAPLIPAAQERGLHVILAGIDAENVASLRLHRSFGFEPAAHFKQVGHKFGRWLDVIYLQRFL